MNGGGRVRTKKLKGGKYIHICFKDGKSYAGEVRKSKETITWYSDILFENYKTEEGLSENKLKIKGTAIKARESRNGVTYEFAELEKAANSLRGKTISLDHSESVLDTVGIIDKVIPTSDGLDFEGVVFNTDKHSDVTNLVRNNLIRHVSIEALPPKYELNKEGAKVAKEIEFIGLGFVRHPGIPESSVSLAEALQRDEDEDEDEFDVEEITDENIILKNKKRENITPKKIGENMEEQTKKEEPVNPILEKLVSKLDETAKLKEELEVLRNEIKSLREAPKGHVLTEDRPHNIIVESKGESSRKDIGRAVKEAFVVGPGDRPHTMEAFSAHPEEFY